jgi:uncharacterized protein (TIGR02598 family)
MKRAVIGSGLPQGSFRRPGRHRAFSLVEVVLALGVVSFALLGMVALLPIGIQSTKDSLEETNAINILSGLIADRKATTFANNSVRYSLPALTNGMAFTSNTFGVTPANTNSANFNQSIYRVTYQITPPTAGLDPFQVYFKVSWPAIAASTNASGFVEAAVSFPQP